MLAVPIPCLDEQTVDRLVRGLLPKDVQAAVEEHLAGCASCVELVALAAADSMTVATAASRGKVSARGQALVPGATVGRYTVLSLVGRGGMAEVYAAYDPELDRKVALKLILDADAPGQSARLVREAKALARLSHPNVVTVHEVGTVGDQVFIAMEFVEGQTLAQWCKTPERSWDETLGVFLAAGRGLAAAHHAGLVHRDFKPQNVMVRGDGQVRVMDFGLARSLSDVGGAPAQDPAKDAPVKELPAGAGEPAAASVVETEAALAQLTLTGALVGTPLYMAPEQISGGALDARTDQFSFCVSLYAALHGHHPFGGERVSTLFASVMAGRLREPPAQSRVPAWLHRVIVRGLRPAAGDRWPSMDVLLAALEHDPLRGRRRALAVAGAVVLVAAAALALGRASTAQRSLCQLAPDRLRGVWEGGPDGAARGAVRAAFMKTERSYAGISFRTVSELLDSYVTAWRQMYREACEATHLRGEQSTDVLDLRMECLQGRLQSLRALTEVFATATASVVENAVSAAAALPPLGRCADVKLLREVIQPPSQAAVRARVQELRQQVAMMKALGDAGRCTAAAERAPPIIAAARALEYLPLLAEALDVAGWLGNDCLDARAAARYAREAAGVAEAAHHDELAANAAVLAATMLGERLGEFHDAEQWATQASWKIQRIGGAPLLESWRQVAIGNALALEGRYTEALAAEREALSIKQKLFGPEHVDVARSHGNVAYVLARLGRNQEALDQSARALAIVEPRLGADHPLLARLEENRGAALLQAGRAADARGSFERALGIWRRSGSDEFFQVEALIGVGESCLRQGAAGDGIHDLQRAVSILEAGERGAGHLGAARFALARALWTEPGAQGRARGLALDARSDFARLPSLEDRTAEVERWLAARPGGRDVEREAGRKARAGASNSAGP